MSGAVVESRRFRTWDESRELEAKHRWRLLIKMQFQRYWKTWYFWVLVAYGILFAVASLIAPFALADNYLQGQPLTSFYFMGALFFVGATVLLIASPAISEDIRYNAPLFYFSRPIRVIDYFIGKVGFLAILTFGLLLVPLLFLGFGSLMNLDLDGYQPPGWVQNADPNYRDSYVERDQAYWEVNAMNSVGDWLFVNWTMWAGTVSVLTFIVGLSVLTNTFTNRAWHAAIAFIVVFGAWSMIGTGAGVLMSDTVSSILLSPAGWMFGATQLGVDDYFTDNQWSREWMSDAPLTVALSHMFLIGFGLAMMFWAYRRLKALEGAV